MEDSVFTKIIKGDIPCHKVYEDEYTLAFLDIHPLIEGHVLVVPKKQVDDFEQLPPEYYAGLFDSVKKVSLRVKSVMGKRKAAILVLGFDVAHAHVHVLPTDSSTDFYEAIEHRNPDSEPDHAELAKIAEKLAF